MPDRIFTAAEKLAAVEREIAMRRRVYPRWVEGGRLTQKAADEQIAVMEAIRADYATAAAQERLL